MIEFLMVLLVVVVLLRNRALSKENDELRYSLVQQDSIRQLNQEIADQQEEDLDEINETIVDRAFFD